MAERQVAMEKELSQAREAQKNAKLKQRSEMAMLEQDEFLRVVDANRQKEQEEVAQVSGVQHTGAALHLPRNATALKRLLYILCRW
jgi:hypothetical protein